MLLRIVSVCTVTTRHKLLPITHGLPTFMQGDNTQALQEAQDQITILRQEVDTLRREKDTNNTSSGSAELEKELQELKDRNTALEHQLMEYAGTISDQSKVLVVP